MKLSLSSEKISESICKCLKILIVSDHYSTHVDYDIGSTATESIIRDYRSRG